MSPEPSVLSAQRTRFVLGVTSITLMLAVFAWRFTLLQTREFDPDELQHLHAAWAIHHGLLPYRDFFEHHMPTLQYGLGWVVGALETSAEGWLAVIQWSRIMMWLLALASVLITMAVGMELGGAAVLWMSGALLSSSLVFVARTLEIRPDVPALVCWMASLLMLVRASAAAQPGDRRRVQFLAAGLWLGCALAFNQKLLLAGPGMAVFVLWYLAGHVSSIKAKVRDIGILTAATLLPLVVLAGVYWQQHALGNLLAGTFLNNLGWAREVSPLSTLKWMLLRDPLFSGLAVAGFVQAAFDLVRTPRDTRLAAIVLPIASLVVGLAITPAPYPQYMLLILPAGAVLAARAVWRVTSAPAISVDGGLALITGVTVAALGLNVARPFFMHVLVFPMFLAGAIAAMAFLALTGRREWSAALLLLTCSVYSLQQLRWMQGLSNGASVAEMRFVAASTTPSDTILDGFTGVGWFRPNADFYPFFHAGVRARLTPGDVRRVLDLFMSCTTRPRVVILDRELAKVSPELGPIVHRYYTATPYPFTWLRKEPCAA